MPTMEQIIRPFQDQGVGPAAYLPTSGQDDKPALVKVGLRGGTKTFNGDFQYQQATKLGAVHMEVSPNSGSGGGGSSSACCDSAEIQNVLHNILPGA